MTTPESGRAAPKSGADSQTPKPAVNATVALAEHLRRLAETQREHDLATVLGLYLIADASPSSMAWALEWLSWLAPQLEEPLTCETCGTVTSPWSCCCGSTTIESLVGAER